MRRVLLSLLLIPLLAIALSACLPTNTPAPAESAPPTSENMTETTPTPNQEVADTADQEVDIQINMQDFSFTPAEITAQAGETLVIELTSSQGFHNFVIDELNVTSDTLSDGQTSIVTIEIPADAAGETYDFYCAIMNHRAMGMEGVLRVE